MCFSLNSSSASGIAGHSSSRLLHKRTSQTESPTAVSVAQRGSMHDTLSPIVGKYTYTLTDIGCMYVLDLGGVDYITLDLNQH